MSFNLLTRLALFGRVWAMNDEFLCSFDLQRDRSRDKLGRVHGSLCFKSPTRLPPWPSSTSISSPSYITSLAAMRVFFPIARIPLICSPPPLHPCRPLNLILPPCFPPPRQVLRPLRSPHARPSSCL